MHYILSIGGIVGSFYLLKYRERMGDMMGEAEWMKRVGGVYMVIVVFAIFIFFWSIAELTNSTDYFLAPLRLLLPHQAPTPTF
jgi:hypothetical protein